MQFVKHVKNNCKRLYIFLYQYWYLSILILVYVCVWPELLISWIYAKQFAGRLRKHMINLASYFYCKILKRELNLQFWIRPMTYYFLFNEAGSNSFCPKFLNEIVYINFCWYNIILRLKKDIYHPVC